MSTTRIQSALGRAHMLIDYNIHKDIHKQYEFIEQIILADNSLTEEESNNVK
jgi:hypothetical protein